MGLHIAWDGPRIYLEILLIAGLAYALYRANR
jgi:hypothetical protein